MRLLVAMPWLVAAAATLAACGGGVASVPSQSVSLSAAPSAYAFTLQSDYSSPIDVTRSSGVFSSLTFGFSDPTIAGVTAVTFSGTKATFSILAISPGTTTVTAKDSSGATAAVNVTVPPCSGSPPQIVAAQQVVPPNGATGVSTAIEGLVLRGL